MQTTAQDTYEDWRERTHRLFLTAGGHVTAVDPWTVVFYGREAPTWVAPPVLPEPYYIGGCL